MSNPFLPSLGGIFEDAGNLYAKMSKAAVSDDGGPPKPPPLSFPPGEIEDATFSTRRALEAYGQSMPKFFDSIINWEISKRLHASGQQIYDCGFEAGRAAERRQGGFVLPPWVFIAGGVAALAFYLWRLTVRLEGRP